MADFAIVDGHRFRGDFSLHPIERNPPVIVTVQQEAYLSNLDAFMKWLANPDVEHGTLGEVKENLRWRTSEMLREDAQNFVAGRLRADLAHDLILVTKGRYLAEKETCEGQKFIVSLVPPEASRPGAARCLATDLHINLPNGGCPEDKEKLVIGIHATLTVLRAVCARQSRRLSKNAERTLDRYVRAMHGIAQVGLESDQTKLAQGLVEALQREYFAVEAPKIKNRYVFTLFVIMLIFSGAFLSLYFSIRWTSMADCCGEIGKFLEDHKEFFLLTAGAAVGAWLSFSSRDVSLTFADLGSLEGNLLGPLALVLFAIGFTIVAGLLFWTGAISIGLGRMSSDHLVRGSVALVIGIFCGLSERGLATAISGRATTFVQGVGSK